MNSLAHSTRVVSNVSKSFKIFFAAVLLTFLAGAAIAQTFYTDWTATGDSSPSHVIEPLLGAGSDGDFTVTAANTVLNNYAILGAPVGAGSLAFTVTNIADLDSSIPQLGPIAPGDLLMIIQMQGATIDTTDTVNYGSVTALNSAGLYEFVTIDSIAGNTITINENCVVGLRNSYTTTGHTQVVRVPQFNNLTVNAGASVVPTAWNGATGAVVVLQMADTLTLNGFLNASGSGFRGGAATNNGFVLGSVIYRTTNVNNGAPKGEGIAGSVTDYDLLGGRFGRGAPANGGGGGNSTNAPGGGGANGNNGNTWTGQGVMPGTVTGAAAWQLDPGFIANGNALTNSSGGGRGGYSWSNANLNALAVGPGNAAWVGDNRREVGGLGGRPVDNDPASRLFFGGGGGAGDMNNNSGSSGGRGAGLVFVMAAATTGTGSILVVGGNGGNTVCPGGPGSGECHHDAPGGGGAGGTVVLSSQTLTGAITINANGGNGGSHSAVPGGPDTALAPGGGGGGGYIAVRTGTPTRTTNGGVGGTTASPALTEFPRDGSTDGAIGQPTASVTTIPICLVPTAANVSISGRVLTPAGSGVMNARVVLTDSQGISRMVVTNPFGHFRFDEVQAGETYVVSVFSKGRQFEPLAITVVDDITDLDIIAQE